MNKYRNQKVTHDGITFDSKKERKRYQELLLMERGKEIYNLHRQVRFELIPSQKVDGNVVERPVHYVADFVYRRSSDDARVVEDVKSEATRKLPAYILKRKLMLFRHKIQVQEI